MVGARETAVGRGEIEREGYNEEVENYTRDLHSDSISAESNHFMR